MELGTDIEDADNRSGGETGGAAATVVGDVRISSALSMKVPRMGAGEMRRGGRGPLHGPIRGGERDSRRPDGEDAGPRRLHRKETTGSTTGRSRSDDSLQEDNTTDFSPELDGDPRSQNLLDGEGKPASVQNS